MIGLPQIDMNEVTRLTREGRLMDAIDLLQGRRGGGASQAPRSAGAAPARTPDGIIDLSPPTEPGGSWSRRETTTGGDDRRKAPTTKRGLGQAIRETLGRLDPRTAQPDVPVPAGARFEERSFSCAKGARDFRLYVPSRHAPGCALVVMLHGCTQGPEDFAVGTGMNALAERDGFIVAYPAQTGAANTSRCWNWFRPSDQRRDAGEPAIIAGITRAVAGEFGVDPARIYVAGLSASGAAAVVMGEAYPDLYAAIGVHSGLPYGAAHDVPSALAAMRSARHGTHAARHAHLVPTIVFHGDRDRTVHSANGGRIVDALRARHDLVGERERPLCGEMAVQHDVFRDADGRPMIEHWLVEGAGHAWSGGDPNGSFVEPRGPRASEEMIRFFEVHRLKRAP